MATAFTGISKRNTTDILRNMSGRLFKSFNPQTAESGDSDYKISLTGNIINAEIGSNVPYAAIHNYGGTIDVSVGLCDICIQSDGLYRHN